MTASNSVSYDDVIEITPLAANLDAIVRVPGSKSITNRALLCAALAPGKSVLKGVLFADDTRAMLDSIKSLGAKVYVNKDDSIVTVEGIDPRYINTPVHVNARQSGTTSRFLLSALALSPRGGILDGAAQLRARPFAPQIDALLQAGAKLESLEVSGYLPIQITSPATGGDIAIPGNISSQFLSGMLMAGRLMPKGINIKPTTSLVSVPYLDITKAVMKAFGVSVDGLRVEPGVYTATEYDVEPDASAASYFLGAAAITGGRVTVEGLGTSSSQGDVAFADVLELMGAKVEREPNHITVTGPAQLHGIEVDMADISDTAQTFAAVAVHADTPSRVHGIGFIRGKETDRIAAIVTELRRAGIEATEEEDGFTITPGVPKPTTFETYDDHRMAMSLSLLGLRNPGIRIKDPSCVSKTYPHFFNDLNKLQESE